MGVGLGAGSRAGGVGGPHAPLLSRAGRDGARDSVCPPAAQRRRAGSGSPHGDLTRRSVPGLRRGESEPCRASLAEAARCVRRDANRRVRRSRVSILVARLAAGGVLHGEPEGRDPGPASDRGSAGRPAPHDRRTGVARPVGKLERRRNPAGRIEGDRGNSTDPGPTEAASFP